MVFRCLAQQHTFLAGGCGGILLYGLLLAVALWRVTDRRTQILSSLGFADTLRVLARDRAFLLLAAW